MTINTDIFEDINNAILDLQASQLQTYERPLKDLARYLSSPELTSANESLTQDIDLDAFLAQNARRGGGMVGGDHLNWPDSRHSQLGIILLLIQKFAINHSEMINFGHTYFYTGRKIIGDIHAIVSQMIIPFFRDYKRYVIRHSQSPEPVTDEGKDAGMSHSDGEDLLDALWAMNEASSERPSVIKGQQRYLPDWDRDRLMAATDSLLQVGDILNPTGPLLWVDISSGARKRAAARAAPTPSQVINIGTNTNSPLQQVGAGGSGTQNTQYNINKEDLRSVVEIYHQHADELGLDASTRRRADAQVATIEAQLLDEPDPTIVKAAGRSLRTIIEGAIGGAAGNVLANPGVWERLLSLFS